MKWIIAITATVCITTAGCSAGIQLAASTAISFARAQQLAHSIIQFPSPQGPYEIMQDILSGKGVLVGGRYCPTPGIVG